EVIVYLGEVLHPRFARDCSFITSSDGKPTSLLPGKSRASGTSPLDLFGLIQLLAHNSSRFLQVLQEGSMGPEHDIFEAFRLMMHFCKWWSRVWVVQEIVLPERVIVVYGSMALPWTEFAQAARQIAPHRSMFQQALSSDHTKVLDNMSHRILEIEDMRRAYRSAGGMSLLGMAGSEQSGVTPDYTLSESQVFQNTIVDMIGQMKSLDPITGELARKYTAKLPSWESDWSVTYEPADRIRLENVKHYRASLHYKVHIQKISGHGSLVGIEDVAQFAQMERNMVDELAVGMPNSQKPTSLQSSPHGAQIVAHGFDWYSSYRGGNCSIRDAFARTICGDLLWDGAEAASTSDGFRRVDASDHVELAAWLRVTFPDLTWEEDCGITNNAVPDNSFGTVSQHVRGEGGSNSSLDRVTSSVHVATSRRRFFITSSGFMGLGPVGMRVGDQLHILLGGKTPFVLRPAESGDEVGFFRDIEDMVGRIDKEVVGDCYVHGIMDGEEMSHLQTDEIDFAFHHNTWTRKILTRLYAKQRDLEQNLMGHLSNLELSMKEWAVAVNNWETGISVEPVWTAMREAAHCWSTLGSLPNAPGFGLVQIINRAEQAVCRVAELQESRLKAVAHLKILPPRHQDSYQTITEASSNMEEIELRFLKAEEQMRIMNRQWPEICSQSNYELHPTGNYRFYPTGLSVLRSVFTSRERDVLAWKQLTWEWQDAARCLWRSY
ncbi:hypothetical protein QBC35DRAFT_476227, partial [Podospora australis]